MEQVQGGRGVLHLVHGQVQVQQLDQLLGWGRERYHEGRDEGGKEESSDRQLLHKQLFQLLVVHVFLNGMAQLFLRDDCSEHGHGKHGGLLHGVSGGVEVPHKVGDGLAG